MSDPELEKLLKDKMKEYLRDKTVVEDRVEGLIILNADNFEKIISGERQAIVDFWAEWCAPCRVMHPIFEKLAKKYGDRMIFARLNVDENQSISAKYQVLSIPTFIIFKNQAPIDTLVGAIGEDGMENFVRKHLPQ